MKIMERISGLHEIYRANPLWTNGSFIRSKSSAMSTEAFVKSFLSKEARKSWSEGQFPTSNEFDSDKRSKAKVDVQARSRKCKVRDNWIEALALSIAPIATIVDYAPFYTKNSMMKFVSIELHPHDRAMLSYSFKLIKTIRGIIQLHYSLIVAVEDSKNIPNFTTLIGNKCDWPKPVLLPYRHRW